MPVCGQRDPPNRGQPFRAGRGRTTNESFPKHIHREARLGCPTGDYTEGFFHRGRFSGRQRDAHCRTSLSGRLRNRRKPRSNPESAHSLDIGPGIACNGDGIIGDASDSRRVNPARRYHSPFKPFGVYPYRRAVLAIHVCGEHCSPVRWFSRKG